MFYKGSGFKKRSSIAEKLRLDVPGSKKREDSDISDLSGRVDYSVSVSRKKTRKGQFDGERDKESNLGLSGENWKRSGKVDMSENNFFFKFNRKKDNL